MFVHILLPLTLLLSQFSVPNINCKAQSSTFDKPVDLTIPLTTSGHQEYALPSATLSIEFTWPIKRSLQHISMGDHLEGGLSPIPTLSSTAEHAVIVNLKRCNKCLIPISKSCKGVRLPCGQIWCTICINKLFLDTAKDSLPGEYSPPHCKAHPPEGWHEIKVDGVLIVALSEETMSLVRRAERQNRAIFDPDLSGGEICPICQEEVRGREYVHLACEHRICVDCLNDSVRYAMGSRATWPPKCCEVYSEMLGAEDRSVYPALSDGVQSVLTAKEEELDSSNPMYCPEPDCGAFISE